MKTLLHGCGYAFLAFAAFFSLGSLGQLKAQIHEPLPKIDREYRGVWVATVANIDWPSKPGLPVPKLQEEIVSILDKVQELRMNVVVLQVRTSCDAFYNSPYEPWSYYLTGEQGKAPESYFDPLTYWIDESHKRGLELHAWFNPFRAKNSGQKYKDSESHISNTHPGLVKKYGNDATNYLWLDPGEEEARAHSMKVFMDVVNRYDIDGVHIDDYFYPYPVANIPFPDDPAWERYTQEGGKLTRDDWRRHSMNEFIKNLYQEIKAAKPHVKFGISPFGIWKPGYPEGVAGMSQYDQLYADAKLWLNEGWCDYYTPQLYWSISARQQSFPALLAWWVQENHKERHIAPGLYTGKVMGDKPSYTAEQIENQVFLARYMPGSHGSVHFSMKSLQRNAAGLSERLQANAYINAALAPACPWIDETPPAAPILSFDPNQPAKVTWTSGDSERARRWCVYQKIGKSWSVTIQGADDAELQLPTGEKRPSKIAIVAIDGANNASEPAFLVVP